MVHSQRQTKKAYFTDYFYLVFVRPKIHFLWKLIRLSLYRKIIIQLLENYTKGMGRSHFLLLVTSRKRVHHILLLNIYACRQVIDSNQKQTFANLVPGSFAFYNRNHTTGFCDFLSLLSYHFNPNISMDIFPYFMHTRNLITSSPKL